MKFNSPPSYISLDSTTCKEYKERKWNSPDCDGPFQNDKCEELERLLQKGFEFYSSHKKDRNFQSIKQISNSKNKNLIKSHSKLPQNYSEHENYSINDLEEKKNAFVDKALSQQRTIHEKKNSIQNFQEEEENMNPSPKPSLHIKLRQILNSSIPKKNNIQLEKTLTTRSVHINEDRNQNEYVISTNDLENQKTERLQKSNRKIYEPHKTTPKSFQTEHSEKSHHQEKEIVSDNDPEQIKNFNDFFSNKTEKSIFDFNISPRVFKDGSFKVAVSESEIKNYVNTGKSFSVERSQASSTNLINEERLSSRERKKLADLNKYSHKSKTEIIVDKLNIIHNDIASLEGNEKNIESLMTQYSKSKDENYKTARFTKIKKIL